MIKAHTGLEVWRRIYLDLMILIYTVIVGQCWQV